MDYSRIILIIFLQLPSQVTASQSKFTTSLCPGTVGPVHGIMLMFDPQQKSKNEATSWYIPEEDLDCWIVLRGQPSTKAQYRLELRFKGTFSIKGYGYGTTGKMPRNGNVTGTDCETGFMEIYAASDAGVPQSKPKIGPICGNAQPHAFNTNSQSMVVRIFVAAIPKYLLTTPAATSTAAATTEMVTAGRNMVVTNMVGTNMVDTSTVVTNTVGMNTGGMDMVGTSRLSMNTVGMDMVGTNTVAMNTVGMDMVGTNTVGMNTGGMDKVGTNTVGTNTGGMDTVGTNTGGMDTVDTNTVGTNTGGTYVVGMDSSTADNTTIAPPTTTASSTTTTTSGTTTTPRPPTLYEQCLAVDICPYMKFYADFTSYMPSGCYEDGVLNDDDQIYCLTGRCIDISLVCDSTNSNNCGDWSDQVGSSCIRPTLPPQPPPKVDYSWVYALIGCLFGLAVLLYCCWRPGYIPWRLARLRNIRIEKCGRMGRCCRGGCGGCGGCGSCGPTLSWIRSCFRCCSIQTEIRLIDNPQNPERVRKPPIGRRTFSNYLCFRRNDVHDCDVEVDNQLQESHSSLESSWIKFAFEDGMHIRELR